MISPRAFKMNFEEFQNQSRFYVVGALEAGEVEEFEREREKFGKQAQDFVTQFYALQAVHWSTWQDLAVRYAEKNRNSKDHGLRGYPGQGKTQTTERNE